MHDAEIYRPGAVVDDQSVIEQIDPVGNGKWFRDYHEGMHIFRHSLSDGQVVYLERIGRDSDHRVNFLAGVRLCQIGKMSNDLLHRLLAPFDSLLDDATLEGLADIKAEAEAGDVLSAMTTQAEQSYVPPMEFAYLTLALGQRDRALQWIETAVREKSRWVEWLAVDPILEPLREEPRFKAALASLKLGPLP